ncbi:MAG: alpha-hydroxy acid oxidase [Paracoccaceae bacterium]
MDLHARYPGLDDLRKRAKQRLPHFAWEYLDSGTGVDAARTRNRTALDRIGFLPGILHGIKEPDLNCNILGEDMALPFGVAPVGMSGLFWPGAEQMLARAAAAAQIPYTLSTVASQSPEDVAPALGPHAWFQLYPPKEEAMRLDMLERIKAAGFRVLVLTVDVPVASRRERQVRSGLQQPPRLTPRIMAQVAIRPAWALASARRGMPKLRTLEKYVPGPQKAMPPGGHIGYLLRASPDLDYVKWLRDRWDGPLVIKGVMRVEDTEPLQAAGVDALWVSNHGGRQFDGTPASIEVLPDIRAASNLPVIFDSGIEGGLDVIRALSLGADFVMLGRAFHYAVAALGAAGPAHLIDMFRQDISSCLGQMGVPDLSEIPAPIRLD